MARLLDIACVDMQESQLSETLSTCRFAHRMMQVTVDAQKNKGGMSSVHGNLFKLDPVMQQYLEVCTWSLKHWSFATRCLVLSDLHYKSALPVLLQLR